MHDHPVSFLSVILRGGYTERRQKPTELATRHRPHRWFNWVTASLFDRHQITTVKPGTVTLALMGPKTREWGYHTDTGWVHWKTYHDALREKEAHG